MDSGFCVAKGITDLKSKGIYGSDLIKMRRYWTKGVTRDLVDIHFDYTKVVGVGMI